jgi:thiol-disulfide isomerase/thioredoxin
MFGTNPATSFFSPTTGLLLLLGVLVAAALAFWFFGGSSKQGFDANREHGDAEGDGGDKKAVLHFFYANWCPHCKTAKPEWEAFKKEYDGTQIDGYRLYCEEHDCSDHDADPEVGQLIQTFKVAGFPTVKLVKDDKVIECNARPSRATLAEFVQTVL